MSLSDIADKENQSPCYESAKKVSEVTSILKPQNLLSFSPFPSNSSKKPGKVSFKNTPQRHCPIRYKGEALWTDIRNLDEEEHWTERTQVVTKEDHDVYLEVARVIVGEIIDSISDTSNSVEDMSSSPTAQSNQDLGTSTEEQGQGLLSDVPRRLDHVNNKERPVSLLEFLGNERLVEMAAAKGTDLEKELSKISEGEMELEKDVDVKVDKIVSSPSPVVAKASNTKAKEEVDEEGKKPRKAMPPKPWLQKKKKNAKKQNQDPLVMVDFPQFEELSKADSQPVGGTVEEDNTVEEAKPENEVNTLLSPREDCGTGDVDAGPTHGHQLSEEETREILEFGDDDFKPADNVFSLELDYLERCGNDGHESKLSALARESLYVKFDPLVKAQSPAGLSGAPNRPWQPANYVSLGDDLLLMNTPPPQHQGSLAARLAAKKLLNDTLGPAGFASPQGVDKLLNLSPMENSTNAGANDDLHAEEERGTKLATSENGSHLIQPLLYCKGDVEAAVKREREIVFKQSQEERAIHEMEVQELIQKDAGNILEINRLKQENAELKMVMKEFEKTMSQMIDKEEQSRSESNESHSELIKERDQLQADLNSVESSFAELHRRYEKLKGHVENFKKNEEILKAAAKEYQDKQKKAEEKYQLLKKHAEEKIENANIEIARVRKSNESEIIVMRAALKLEQTRASSMEQNLQQKINENAELTAICDELISRVGSK